MGIKPIVMKKQRSTLTTALGIVSLFVIVGLVYLFWNSVTNDKSAPPNTGLIGAFRPAVKIVNERAQLNEGQSKIYSFTLRTDARVQVQVNAQPKNVDVMLMSPAQAQRFADVSGRIFDRNYTYNQSLSGLKVLTMDKTAVLSAGEWSIVVKRPVEAVLFQDPTDAQVTVTAY
jgi:hypothetical protein